LAGARKGFLRGHSAFEMRCDASFRRAEAVAFGLRMIRLVLPRLVRKSRPKSMQAGPLITTDYLPTYHSSEAPRLATHRELLECCCLQSPPGGCYLPSMTNGQLFEDLALPCRGCPASLSARLVLSYTYMEVHVESRWPPKMTAAAKRWVSTEHNTDLGHFRWPTTAPSISSLGEG
jgi:hypothetical protein